MITLRLNQHEKNCLNMLSKESSMSVSAYVKLKLFENNPDYIHGKTKFISPSKSTNDYFVAYNISRIFFLLQSLYEKQTGISSEELKQIKESISEHSRSVIEPSGYRRIEVTDNE